MVEVAKAIEPGSTEYGTRQGLEADLASVSGAPVQGGAAAGAGVPQMTIPEDPIGGLLSGEAPGNDQLPVTDGLSVGPGMGGPTGVDPKMLTPRAERVRDLAINATSHSIRQAARNELRRMHREAI